MAANRPEQEAQSSARFGLHGCATNGARTGQYSVSAALQGPLPFTFRAAPVLYCSVLFCSVLYLPLLLVPAWWHCRAGSLWCVRVRLPSRGGPVVVPGLQAVSGSTGRRQWKVWGGGKRRHAEDPSSDEVSCMPSISCNARGAHQGSTLRVVLSARCRVLCSGSVAGSWQHTCCPTR